MEFSGKTTAIDILQGYSNSETHRTGTRIQAFLGKNLGAHVEAGCHSMVADFDLISSQDAKILHA